MLLVQGKFWLKWPCESMFFRACEHYSSASFSFRGGYVEKSVHNSSFRSIGTTFITVSSTLVGNSSSTSSSVSLENIVTMSITAWLLIAFGTTQVMSNSHNLSIHLASLPERTDFVNRKRIGSTSPLTSTCVWGSSGVAIEKRTPKRDKHALMWDIIFLCHEVAY